MKTWLAIKATISMDHCVSNGAEAAQFIQALPQEHTCTAPDAQSPRSVAEWECGARSGRCGKVFGRAIEITGVTNC